MRAALRCMLAAAFTFCSVLAQSDAESQRSLVAASLKDTAPWLESATNGRDRFISAYAMLGKKMPSKIRKASTWANTEQEASGFEVDLGELIQLVQRAEEADDEYLRSLQRVTKLEIREVGDNLRARIEFCQATARSASRIAQRLASISDGMRSLPAPLSESSQFREAMQIRGLMAEFLAASEHGFNERAVQYGRIRGSLSERLNFFPRSYGPMDVVTKFGSIQIKGLKLWDTALPGENGIGISGDSRFTAVIIADIDNQTKTIWHTPTFKLTFHCPGEASPRTYTFVIATLREGVSTISDRTALHFGQPCNADTLAAVMTGGDSDREREEKADVARQEILKQEAVIAEAKREAEAEERKEAEIEKRRLSAERTLAARERAREAAYEKERAAYLSKLPFLESGGEMIFIGSDRKCSEQFVQAMNMDGLDKRKRMADLISYGCGFTDPHGLHVTRVNSDGAYCQIAMAEGKHQSDRGWVLCSWIH